MSSNDCVGCRGQQDEASRMEAYARKAESYLRRKVEVTEKSREAVRRHRRRMGPSQFCGNCSNSEFPDCQNDGGENVFYHAAVGCPPECTCS